jgi:hypothetical protein
MNHSLDQIQMYVSLVNVVCNSPSLKMRWKESLQYLIPEKQLGVLLTKYSVPLCVTRSPWFYFLTFDS